MAHGGKHCEAAWALMLQFNGAKSSLGPSQIVSDANPFATAVVSTDVIQRTSAILREVQAQETSVVP
jgi:hypothetical protein